MLGRNIDKLYLFSARRLVVVTFHYLYLYLRPRNGSTGFRCDIVRVPNIYFMFRTRFLKNVHDLIRIAKPFSVVQTLRRKTWLFSSNGCVRTINNFFFFFFTTPIDIRFHRNFTHGTRIIRYKRSLYVYREHVYVRNTESVLGGNTTPYGQR